MKKNTAIVVAAAAALLLVTVVAMAMRDSSGGDAPLYRVEAKPFVRRVTAEGTLKAVKATPIATPTEVRRPLKIGWIADDGSTVKSGDVIVRFDPTELENELLLGTEERSTAQNRLTKTTAESSTTRTNLQRDARQAQNELESAKRFAFDDAEIFSRYQQIESAVDQDLAGEKKQYAEEVLRVREGLARTDRDLIGIEDRKAGLRIRNAEQGLKALEIIAPFDGILVLQRDWRGELPRVGSTLWAGSPIGEIPELAEMKAEVFVLEADAAGLAVDQKVSLWLEAQPDVKYNGKVTAVDKLARPRTRGVPVQYFGVTVTLDRTDRKVMKPGARVRATLEVENLAAAFAIPRQALFEKDGQKLVYRKEGSRFVPVTVTTSSSSAGRVVVTKGLKQGDEIAMNDPTEEAGEDE